MFHFVKCCLSCSHCNLTKMSLRSRKLKVQIKHLLKPQNMKTKTRRRKGVISCFSLFIFHPFQFDCKPQLISFFWFQFKKRQCLKISVKMHLISLLTPPPNKQSPNFIIRSKQFVLDTNSVYIVVIVHPPQCKAQNEPN